MAIFNKDTALEIAYIGAGAVAGKVASEQVYKVLPSEVTSKIGTYEGYVKGAIPILVGLFLPRLAGSTTIVRGLANGMIASGASTIVGKAIEDAGVFEKGSAAPTGGAAAGLGNVMMGNVMMSGYGDQSLIMGEGDSDFSSNSQDFTSAYAGEMDY
jgi:hypothetical protein